MINRTKTRNSSHRAFLKNFGSKCRRVRKMPVGPCQRPNPPPQPTRLRLHLSFILSHSHPLHPDFRSQTQLPPPLLFKSHVHSPAPLPPSIYKQHTQPALSPYFTPHPPPNCSGPKLIGSSSSSLITLHSSCLSNMMIGMEREQNSRMLY